MTQRNLGLLGVTLVILGFVVNVATGVVAASVMGGHTPAATITGPGGAHPPGSPLHRPGGGFFGPGGSGQPGNRR